MVMTVLLTNNARSTLLNGINALQTEIRLRAGGGNTFPTITAAGQWFPITIEDALGNIEIMRVIARSGDVFTVKRAQEGTTAKSFSANDVVELRLTVGAMQELVNDTHTNFGRIYMTPADGVDSKIGVPAGYYFNVRSPSDDSYVDEYQNVNGVAVATGKSYPSGALTQAMSEQIDKIGSLDYLSEQLDQIAIDKGWDASFVVDGGKNQHQINNDQAKTNLSIINYVNPKMFGAVGDGVADDTQPLRDCFNYMLANDAIFYDYSESTYNFTENISIIAPNKKITIKGNCRFKSTTSYITFSGSISLIGNIVSPTTQNSRVVPISISSGLVDGDIIAIQNTRPFSFNNYREYYYDGEIKDVLSVSTDSITLKSGLETSYPGGIEDKVYKISPIVLDIDGPIFDCNGFAGVRIQLAADSKFNLDGYNKLNLTNASYGIVFDRVYRSKMTGGKGVKLGLGNSGTDYGIVASNCQDLLIEADYAYGHRHAGAMGGGDVLGAIPNRRVYFEKSKLENSNTIGVHCADIHGNSINCHYKICDIQGLVGLGGEQCYSIENTITVNADEIRVPIFMTEVSGECGSIDDTILDCGKASNICGWASSGTARLNTKPYAFVVRNTKIGSSTNLIGIMSAVSVGVNDSRFIVDGFDFLNGVPATLTRLLTYAESAASGVTAAKPSFIQVTGCKNQLPDSVLLIASDGNLPNVTKRTLEQNGSNANGSWIKQSDGTMICRHRLSATVTFNTAYQGGYKSADLAWTYPKAFIGVPTIMAIALDNASQAMKAKPPTSASVNVFGFSSVSYSSAGVVVDLIAIGRHLS